ncbi:MAG: hypothetical protein GTO16_08240 [Candidatus Aminicenantes bacterium]|nr:hypothetical protein [Candidatus Aminicenantes bacterium]
MSFQKGHRTSENLNKGFKKFEEEAMFCWKKDKNYPPSSLKRRRPRKLEKRPPFIGGKSPVTGDFPIVSISPKMVSGMGINYILGEMKKTISLIYLDKDRAKFRLAGLSFPFLIALPCHFLK